MTLTYRGSTAGSTLANPPVLLAAAIGGHVQYVTSGSTAAVSPNMPTGASGAKLWFYSSSNVGTDLVALNSIGDGVALGMTIGDVLLGVQTSADSTSPFLYLAVLASSAGATGFGLSSSILSSTAV